VRLAMLTRSPDGDLMTDGTTRRWWWHARRGVRGDVVAPMSDRVVGGGGGGASDKYTRGRASVVIKDPGSA
jgi:hypothetical protein